MPIYLLIILAVVILFPSCRNNTPDTKSRDEFALNLDKANNDLLHLPERLVAAHEAYRLALRLNDISKQAESDRAKGVLYLEMDSLEQALSTFSESAELATSIGDKRTVGMALNNIALIHSDRSDYDSAITYYEHAIEIYKSIPDSLRLSQTTINAGIAYKNDGRFEKAFSVTLSAIHIMESMKPSADLGTAYTTLGNILKDLRRSEESLEYHHKAIAIRSEFKDSAGIAGSFNNIGNVYKSMNEYSKALKYYVRSLELKKRLGLKRSLVTTIDNIAETYTGMKQYELAEQYEKEALALRSVKVDPDGWMTSNDRLAKIYIARNELGKAKDLALQIAAVAAQPDYRRQQLSNALLLKDIYLAMHEYQKAIEQAGNAITLKDSLFSSEMSGAISAMNVRFRTEEKQKQLELANKNAIIKDQEIRMRDYFMILMGSIIFLFLIITYLLLHSNRLRKKARERVDLLMIELNHRVKNNLQIISDLLNLQTMTTENPREIGIIKAIRSRIQSIGIVHKLLYSEQFKENVDISVLVSELARNLNQSYCDKEQASETLLQVEPVFLKADQAIPLGLIVNEHITNIYKYNQLDNGRLIITIQLKQEGEKCNICILDNGRAWDKTSAVKQKKGLGMMLIDLLAKQLSATTIFNRNEQENIFCITLINR